MKPIVNKKAVVAYKRPPHKVANQLKILIPVGTPINIVAAEK